MSSFRGSDQVPIGRWEVYGIVVAAVGFGLYASWIMADIVPRWLVFPVVVGVVVWRLVSIEDTVSKIAYGCFTAAGLLVLTPVLLFVPDVAAAGDHGVSWMTMFWMEINLVLFVVFLIPAVVIAYIGARFDKR